MGFALVAAASGDYWTTATVQDCTSSLNVAAGDLLVAVIGFRTTARGITSIADTVGGNTMTLTAVFPDSDSDQFMAMGYKIGAAANATATFRLTLDGEALKPSIVVLQFRPDAGDTVSLDTGPSDNIGTGSTLQTDDFSTTGDDEVVVCGKEAANSGSADTQIADAASDGAYSPAQNDIAGWYKLFTSTQSNIHGQQAIGYAHWTCAALSFKSVAAAVGQGAMKRFGGVPHMAVNRGVW